MLYSQEDFTYTPSCLELEAKARGSTILFLPKFHCELNPIEQCWGYAKRVYRLNPASSREEDLVHNALSALDQVPLPTIRRYVLNLVLLPVVDMFDSFFNRAHRFVDAYAQGLDGRQSAWACKRYRGHRMLPDRIMEALDEAGLKK